LSEFLGTELQPATLGADFRKLDAEMRQQAPDADWALYYADWFLDQQPADRA
jgi:hypothetical protein